MVALRTGKGILDPVSLPEGSYELGPSFHSSVRPSMLPEVFLELAQ